MSNWEKLCEMVSVKAKTRVRYEYEGGGNVYEDECLEEHLPPFTNILNRWESYPQANAKIREELEEMVFNHEGIIKYEPFNNSGLNTITWIINDDYEGVDRTEIKRIIES